MPEVLMFSCDHRQTSEWKMPYIRVGSSNTGSVVNTKSDQFLDEHGDDIGEVAKQIFVLKRLSEFGDPDFVGFVNYRRAFTLLQPNNRMIPLYFAKWHQFTELRPNFLTSSQITRLIESSNSQGIVVKPWYDYGVKYSNSIELLYRRLTTQFPEYRFSYDECDKLINLFMTNLMKFIDVDCQLAISQTINYHLICFVFSRQLCDIYYRTMEKSILDLMSMKLYDRILIVLNQIDKSKRIYFRWIGYICEIWYSLFVYAIKQTNSILEIPMIMFED